MNRAERNNSMRERIGREKAEAEEVRKQRDALLAACEAAMPHVYNSPFEGSLDVFAQLEEAIALAKGEK